MAFDASLWGQQATHTINVGQVPSSQSNVPVLITKNLASFPSSMLDGGSTSALNGGGDIRVSTDAAGANQLPVEIVSCITSATPANQELIMWVRVPTVNNSEVIYITWNRAGQSQPPVTDPFGRNAVWQDYAFVTHDGGVTESTAGLAMVDDGSGAATTALYDQAALTAPLQRTSSLTAGDLTSNFSITAWGNFYNNAGTLLSRRDAGTRQYHFGVLANALYFITTSSTSTASLGAVNNVAWTKATVSVTSGTDIDAYVDGASTGNYSRGTISSQSLPLRVGYRGNGGLGTTAAESPATFFECRVRNSTITADFETTEYNNIIDQNAWATIGTPYAPSGGGISVNPLTVNYNITALAADVNTPYDILAATANYNINTLAAAVSFSGAIDVTALPVNYDITALVTTVAVSGDIDIIPQPANVDYTANNTTVSLFGAIDVNVAVTNYNIEAYQAYVQNETISVECICGYEGVITTSINFDGIITGDIGLNGLIDDSDINRVGAIDNSDLAFKGGLCHCG